MNTTEVRRLPDARDDEIRRCGICGRVLSGSADPLSEDCGGDCLSCMADAGDPWAVERIRMAQRVRFIGDDGEVFEGMIEYGRGSTPRPTVRWPERWRRGDGVRSAAEAEDLAAYISGRAPILVDAIERAGAFIQKYAHLVASGAEQEENIIDVLLALLYGGVVGSGPGEYAGDLEEACQMLKAAGARAQRARLRRPHSEPR